MEKINKAEVERYQVTLIDNTYPESVDDILYTGLDIATAKSIARHLNKTSPCYAVWYTWGLAGVDPDRAQIALEAWGWTPEGAREYLRGADLEHWTAVDLEWACKYVQAR